MHITVFILVATMGLLVAAIGGVYFYYDAKESLSIGDKVVEKFKREKDKELSKIIKK
jgi:hypothetical protein